MNINKVTVLLATIALLSPVGAVSFGLFTGTASAAASGNFQYSLTNDGTAVEITGFNGTDASLVIPSIIAGLPVTSIGVLAFCNCTALTTVTIPNSVVSIGAGAFQNCYSLTTLTIPNSVSSIGAGAFYDVGLRSVVIPNSVKIIEDDLFFDCYSLTSVTIPVSVTSIGNYSFYNCYALTSVTIPKSVTSIGAGAFFNCGLRSVVIPESVSIVKERCFQGCYALTSVTIPVSVTSIGNYSFYNCYALTSVTISSNISKLGNDLFGNCYALTSATFTGTVKIIGESAFLNCYSLVSITFYGNAPSMGSGWKTGCSSNMTVYCYQGATGFTGTSFTGATVRTMTSPNAPQNLTAVAGDGIVRLTWNPPSGSASTPILNYLIYQNGTYALLASSTSVTISGLRNGQSYNFTVLVPNTKGNLVNSSSVIVKIPIVGVAVAGTVYDIAGNPMANATVTLGNFTAVMTSEYGFFMVTGVVPGEYGLTIAKVGYTTETQNVTVTSGQNMNIQSIVLNLTSVLTSGDSSGSGDMTLYIVIGAAAVGGVVLFLFFRKRSGGGRRKSKK